MSDSDDMILANIVAKNVQRLRKQQNLTQAELGDQSDFPQFKISSIENENDDTLRLSSMARFAEALGVDIEELLVDVD